MSTVTCHTDDCGNAGIRIELELTVVDDLGQTLQIQQVVCGVCGQPITDIQR